MILPMVFYDHGYLPFLLKLPNKILIHFNSFNNNSNLLNPDEVLKCPALFTILILPCIFLVTGLEHRDHCQI